WGWLASAREGPHERSAGLCVGAQPIASRGTAPWAKKLGAWNWGQALTQGVQLQHDPLEQRARNAPEGDLWISVPAPRIEAEQLMQRGNASFIWSSPTAPGAAIADGPQSCVGLGVARRFYANGEERFRRIEREAGAVLSRVREVADAPRAPKPRVFGGFA